MLRLGQTWEVAAREIAHLGKYPWKIAAYEKKPLGKYLLSSYFLTF